MAENNKDNNFLHDFYDDFDKLKGNKSCGVWIFIILVVLFALIVIGLFGLKRFAANSIEYFRTTEEQTADEISLVEKIELESTIVGEGKAISIRITSEEMQEFLGNNDENFPLKRSEVNIEKEGIKISGRTSGSFLSIPVTIMIKPVVANGKIKFELADVSSGFVSAPLSVKNELSKYLDESVNKNLSAINDINFQEVYLDNGYMDLIGTKEKV